MTIIFRDDQPVAHADWPANAPTFHRTTRGSRFATSTCTISRFTYVDCLVGGIHTIADRGDDEEQAGGFYHDDGDLLGCDLATGCVWRGDLGTTRYSSEWVFEVDGLRGHLIDATVWSRGKQLVVRYATEQAIL